MSIVYTGGTFDLLHAGHIDLLSVCRKVAGKDGKVIVALNRDTFIARFKGKPPICTYQERRDVLLACRYVDDVIENTGDTDSKPAIESARPDFVLIGDDWARKDYYAQMSFTPQWLDEHGITLLYVPRQRRISSTEIKERTYGQLDPLPMPEKSSGLTSSDAGVVETS